MTQVLDWRTFDRFKDRTRYAITSADIRRAWRQRFSSIGSIDALHNAFNRPPLEVIITERRAAGACVVLVEGGITDGERRALEFWRPLGLLVIVASPALERCADLARRIDEFEEKIRR